MKRAHDRADQIIRALQARIPLLYIGGLGVESEGNSTIQIISPADGQAIGRVPAANDRDVERAVIEARHAYHDGWCDSAPNERANILWRTADLVEAEANDFAILETLETGKTVRETRTFDVTATISALRYYAGWVTKQAGEVHQLGGGAFALTHREPFPVVAVIAPWNAPLTIAAWKIGAAIAAGSAVVVKPSELAPFTTLRLAELFHKAGLPQGVLNVITGLGHQAGEALAQSFGVYALSFSGSIESARRILVSSAKSNLKKVSLVLGGKSANILFEDANLKRSVSAIWKSALTSRSATAIVGSRLLVHERIHDEVVSIVTERARETLVGDPLDEHTELGPMITEDHLRRVLAFVDLGRKEGARVVAGGVRDGEGRKANGFYVKPTVLMDVTPTMRVAREEIFGPVLSILRFKSEDEAIEIANGTDYGLAAGVWTSDLACAHRVARRLKAGVVWVNHFDYIDPALPFGGTALAAHGRDLGAAGLLQFSHEKAVYLPTR
ncbi:MAG: aldehyde dehydrogenase family protein [Deltaproteobacteria bacterium]|nr:aldehyde dehydrogenase family protein [Deltaproteobacteria bacterium]